MRRRTAVYVLAAWAVLLAVAVALLTPPAAAAAPITFVDGSASFGAAHRYTGAPVSDDWTFTLGTPATASSALVSMSLAPHRIDITGVEITSTSGGFAQAWTQLSAANPQVWTFAGAVLPPDSYVLRVTGIVPDGYRAGSYGGNLNVSPIPEPGSWALLLAGLAAVGWIARRHPRNRANA